MPNKLEILLSQINLTIREQTEDSSITPSSMSSILDLIANFVTDMSSFQLITDDNGFLIDARLSGLNVSQILGNGTILDFGKGFDKITNNNYISIIGDSETKLALESNYPYTIIPTL